MRSTRIIAASIAALAAGLGSAEAAPLNFADHLICRDIKDSADRHLKYTADFVSNQFGLQPGCQIKVPASQMCWPANRASIAPPAFPSPPGLDLITEVDNYYLCYRVKCERDGQDLILYDSIGGARLVRVKSSKTVCVPGR